MIQKVKSSIRKHVKLDTPLFEEVVNGTTLTLYDDGGSPYILYGKDLYGIRGQWERENYLADPQYWFQQVCDMARATGEVANY